MQLCTRANYQVSDLGMILTAHQPAYMPWLGYFDKLIKSDKFVFLDSVQFEKNSYTNRNRIKTPQGDMWLTVPVKTRGHITSTLAKLEIDNSQDWRKKHLGAVYSNYRKASRFEECYSRLEQVYDKKYDFLADLCWEQLCFWLQELDIDISMVRSSTLGVEAKGTDLILELCRYFEASSYISGILGKDYLREDDFREQGIKIYYQNYQHPVYTQLWSDFLPNMSILDFWMNTDDYTLISSQHSVGVKAT